MTCVMNHVISLLLLLSCSNNIFHVLCKEEEVNFMSPVDKFVLEGTLRIPPLFIHSPMVDDEGTAKFPGVVLLHGSGPLDRDSVLPGQFDVAFGKNITVLKDLATYLEGQGFVVLTYDKRNCGKFNKCSYRNEYPAPDKSLGIDDFLNDAMGAVSYLQSHPSVNPNEITVIGHSQSGHFVPIILNAIPSVKMGILLAAPFNMINTVLSNSLSYTANKVAKALHIDKTAAMARPELKAMETAVHELTSVRTDYELQMVMDQFDMEKENNYTMIQGATKRFWLSWYNLHRTTMKSFVNTTNNQPILIINGDADSNSVSHEASAWGRYLNNTETYGGPNSDKFQVHIMPCISHALNCIKQKEGKPLKAKHIGSSVDNSVKELISSFIIGYINVEENKPEPGPGGASSANSFIHFATRTTAIVSLSLYALFIL